MDGAEIYDESAISIADQNFEDWPSIADSMFGEFTFGLTLEQRKTFYSLKIIYERKARRYADSVIPDWQTSATTENWDLFVATKEKYVSELCEELGLSKAQSDSISYEAYLRNWPLPEPDPSLFPEY